MANSSTSRRDDDEEDEEGDEDESGGEERGEEREKERDEEAKGKKQNADTDPKHLCSCANRSRDHNRLPVREGAFKALAGSSTQKILNSQTLWSVFQDGSKRDQKKRLTRGDTCTSRERSHPRRPLERELLQGPSVPASLGVPLELDRSFCRDSRHGLDAAKT